jgi:small subunit ribosomal protein S16
MAVKIRLSRGGSKKRPFYKMVVAEATAPRDGRFIEKVGTYNPMLSADNKDRVTLVEDRIKYWLSVGAQPTDRVAKFLGAAEIIAMPEVQESPIKSQPKEKAKLRLAEKEQKAADAIAAAQEAKEAAKAAKEQPAEEVVEVTAEKAPQTDDVTVEIGEEAAPPKHEEVEHPAQPVEPEQPAESVEVDVAVEGAEEAHEVKNPESAESADPEKPAE